MPPLAIAAGVAAVGSIGGAVIGASAQKKAAKSASDAEVKMANQNAQLATQFRQQNQANFQPWMDSGKQANSLIDSFLYGPAPTNYYTGQMPAGAQTNAPTQQQQAAAPAPYVPNARQAAVNNIIANHKGSGLGAAMLELGRAKNGQNIRTGEPSSDLYANDPVPTHAAAPAAATGASPFSGYAAFVNSPYYQAPLQEGMRQLNTGLASHGEIESGDAMKAAERYGQDYAYGRTGEYLGLAGQQSDRGLQGASAIAGVGQTALASQSNSNTAIGNAMANRYLATGAANANMYAGIGSALGQFAGSMIPTGSSYGGGLSLSDRRLKTNIQKVGEFKDGLGIYTWNWKSDPAGTTFRGVLADEVKDKRPWAYVPNFRGEYAGVNYAVLGGENA